MRGPWRMVVGPLWRTVDRVERAVVFGCVLVAVLLVPVALTAGSLTYDVVADEGAREAASRWKVTAVLTENGPSGNGAQAYVTGTTVDTPARWRLPNGSPRTGLVPAGHGMKAGDPVDIWVDGSGDRTAPPMSTSDAVATGATVAVLGWVCVVGVLALGCYVLHVVFERRRMRGWQEEWRQLATNSY